MYYSLHFNLEHLGSWMSHKIEEKFNDEHAFLEVQTCIFLKVTWVLLSLNKLVANMSVVQLI